VTAYVLIQATPDADRLQLAQAVAQLPGVDRVQSVSGPYDLIAEVREDASTLTRMTVPEIARLSGVLRVITSPIESPFVLTNQEAAS
jgi:DNA-binding Lrp family transcriptional regulator